MNSLPNLHPRLLLTLLLLSMPTAFWAGQPVGSSSAESRDSRAKPGQPDLVKMEGTLADAEQNHNAACLQQTFADDLIYVAYNGVQLSKQKLMEGLSQLKISTYSMKNFSLKQLGPNNVLMTYDLEVKGSIMGSDLPPKSHATSIWEQRGERWQLIYHAETPQKHSLLSKLFF